MYINIRSRKLRKAVNNQKELTRLLGDRCSRLVQQRLQEIVTAVNLAELMTISGARCHQLKENLAGKFAVDLVNPRRLVFEPEGGLEQFKSGDTIDFKSIDSVIILGVFDYHDKKIEQIL